VIIFNTLVQGCRSLIRGLALGSHPDLVIEGTPKEVKAAEDKAIKQYLSENDRSMVTDEVAVAWTEIIDAFTDYWVSVLAGTEGAAGELRAEYVFPHGLGWAWPP
jgi:hypothetical protein